MPNKNFSDMADDRNDDDWVRKKSGKRTADETNRTLTQESFQIDASKCNDSNALKTR